MLLALLLQAPPPQWEEPWWPGVFKATLPLRQLDVSGRKAVTTGRSHPGNQATVEVVGQGMSEEFAARTQLRLDLTALARATFRLSGSGSLEGRTMLATFSAFDASNIQGLANAQTKALQDLFNAPRSRPSWGNWSLGVSAEPRR
ncbi:MAG TPA: hypothetical protein VJ570_13545 [Holophagaceae bacterium]|nr:hypothetical protein [Holophagaceae bacterium]